MAGDSFFPKISDLGKIPMRILFVISLVTGSILFFPESIVKFLNLSDFLKLYGTYIGITFAVSTAIIFIGFIIWVFKMLLIIAIKIKSRNKLLHEIKNLDSLEQSVIREFYIYGQNTLNLPYYDPIVKGLVSKNVIQLISNTAQVSLTGNVELPMIINNKIKSKLINENIGINPFLSQDEINKIYENNRPKWAIQKDKINNILGEYF